MGWHVAENLVKSGNRVRVLASTLAKAEAHSKAAGSVAAASVGEAVEGADAIFSCLPTSATVDRLVVR